MHDVIVVGGSYAGLSAALQLVRARRSVLVIDEGLRRNRFAARSHGFLGQDGAEAAGIVAAARAQVAAYPTLAWVDGRAETAEGAADGFAVTTADGARHEGRRLVLALGVLDALPAVEGLAERWGRSVFHCPYCHGFELGGGRIGVIGTGPMSLHQAQLIPEWGEVTFLTNGAVALDAEARADLARRGVAVEEAGIARLEGVAEVVMADGRRLSFVGLFTASRTSPSSPLAAGLGCALQETAMGSQVLTDGAKETTVPGAFACGDVARVPHSVALAVADGALAGAQVHRSLVFLRITLPVAGVVPGGRRG